MEPSEDHVGCSPSGEIIISSPPSEETTYRMCSCPRIFSKAIIFPSGLQNGVWSTSGPKVTWRTISPSAVMTQTS